MASPLKLHNGNMPAPNHLTAPLRERVRDADDRLERTARRPIRRQVNRGPTNRDVHIR
jgi:hypothetical protein